MSVASKQRSNEDDIVGLVYCTRVIAKFGIDITEAIDEPFVYRNEWHYITRERARPQIFENVNSRASLLPRHKYISRLLQRSWGFCILLFESKNSFIYVY